MNFGWENVNVVNKTKNLNGVNKTKRKGKKTKKNCDAV